MDKKYLRGYVTWCAIPGVLTTSCSFLLHGALAKVVFCEESQKR